LEGGEASFGLVRTDLGREMGERCRDGVGGLLLGQRNLAVTRPKGADAMLFLGEVRQVEVARERASDLFGALGREALDELLRPRQGLAGRVLERGDREFAQGLDVLEQAGTAVFG